MLKTLLRNGFMHLHSTVVKELIFKLEKTVYTRNIIKNVFKNKPQTP